MNYLKISGGALEEYFNFLHPVGSENIDAMKIFLLIFYSAMIIFILPNIYKYRYKQLKLSCAFPLWILSSTVIRDYFAYQKIILFIIPFHALLFYTILSNSIVCLLGWSFSISYIVTSTFVDCERIIQLAEVTSIIYAMISISFFIKLGWFIKGMRISGCVLSSMGIIDLLLKIFDYEELVLFYLIALTTLIIIFTGVIYKQKAVINHAQ